MVDPKDPRIIAFKLKKFFNTPGNYRSHVELQNIIPVATEFHNQYRINPIKITELCVENTPRLIEYFSKYTTKEESPFPYTEYITGAIIHSFSIIHRCS